MSSILLSNQSQNRACGRLFQQISKQHAEIYVSHRARWRHSGAAASCVAAQQEGHGFESLKYGICDNDNMQMLPVLPKS